MALKSHYIQCSIFLCLIGIGCCLVTGCGDDTQSEQIEGRPQISHQSGDIPPEPETGSEPETQHAEPSLDTNIVVPSDSTVLFDGWTKPSAVLVFTGRQFGYIEPCGCTGLERQKGGLARRYTFLDGLRKRNWDLFAIDTGNQVRRFGRQPEFKFNLTSELLGQMQYAAVGLGPADLKLPAGELFAVAAVDDNDKSMFVSSNVAILDRAFTRRFQLLETPAGTIGLASVISEQWLESLFNDDLIVEETDEALREVVTDSSFQKTDFKVLMVHGTLEYVRELAKSQTDFDLLVCAGAPGEPAYELESVARAKTKILKVGEKSMYASVVGIFQSDTGRRDLKFQRVALDASYQDSSVVLGMFKQYQEELQRSGFRGLGITPQEHASGYQFAGSQSCAECHVSAFEVWKNSPHAHATQSLIAPHGRAEIPRQFDPECLSCHVTGWQAQEYIPYESGFMSLAETMHLEGNGCENCHGPASEHVRLESDTESPVAEREKLRAFVHRNLTESKERCLECHDLDNSPDFHLKGAFEKYWKKIQH